MGGIDSVAYILSEVQEMFGNELFCTVQRIVGMAGWSFRLCGLGWCFVEAVNQDSGQLQSQNWNRVQKLKLWKKESLWCGRIVSGEGVKNDPVRVCAPVYLSCSSPKDELQQFVCTVKGIQIAFRAIITWWKHSLKFWRRCINRRWTYKTKGATNPFDRGGIWV